MKPIDPVMIDKILNQYDQQKKIYADFLERTITLMREFIEPDGPTIHSIEGKIKEKEQLMAKLGNQKKSYSRLNDVPDIASIRIITYFEEEVRVVSEIIRREFNVFPSPEQPKALLTDPNRFGYISMRLQVGLLDNRLELIEYRKFKGFLIELQIRSVLQHAWLEINKHLNFQTKDCCPQKKQREYARIIGLFELTDLELNKIKEFAFQPKKESQPSEEGLTSNETLAPLPDITFTSIPIDMNAVEEKTNLLEKPPGTNKISYEEMERFVLENRTVNTYDRKIADTYDTRLIYKKQSVVTLCQAFCHLDIATIAQIEEVLKNLEKIINPVAKVMFGNPLTSKYEHISKGSSLLMVCYALAAKSGHTNTVFQYINKNFFENDPTLAEESTELIECVQNFLNQ